MISYNKPYFNNKLDPYEGVQPFFYEGLQFGWMKLLQDNYETIKEEFLSVYNSAQKQKEATGKISLDAQKGWNQAELLIYGLKKQKNISLFPKTYSLIKGIDGISSCYFSILNPGTQIEPHVGDTDAYYRFHFGLIIPAELPKSGIQVGSEKRSWRQGEFICFNDVYKHTAWNNTDAIRVVLIVDVLRPFENISKQYIESKVLATLAFARIHKYFWWLFELMPKITLRLFQYVLSGLFKVKLKFQK